MGALLQSGVGTERVDGRHTSATSLRVVACDLFLPDPFPAFPTKRRASQFHGTTTFFEGFDHTASAPSPMRSDVRTVVAGLLVSETFLFWFQNLAMPRVLVSSFSLPERAPLYQKAGALKHTVPSHSAVFTRSHFEKCGQFPPWTPKCCKEPSALRVFAPQAPPGTPGFVACRSNQTHP